ncbi:hypothetical protein GHT07_08070 [Caenimonas koreensis DSM 17982]|uniref:O-GlcNAc transferase C-terminal domain-containing protein n=1 Tax=Caenimonas koreensis DSM 17982 TaxID=1121255 RepID=A0A844B1T5_9BURK|nr:hypothetical protein [Caenimonas koreensis]MRD47232.1 hypothetical protein [Caenimonas koreensis DSM 17982]
MTRPPPIPSKPKRPAAKPAGKQAAKPAAKTSAKAPASAPGSAPAPGAATVPAGNPKGVTVNQILDAAANFAAKKKLPEAIKVLQQAVDHFPPERPNKPTLAGLLVQAATRLRMHHPAGAADLAKEAVERDPELTAGWIMLSGLWDRLGELPQAKVAAKKVVESPTAAPDQVIAAANLLVRYREDQLAIDSARKAFEEMGRPLAWASAVMYIAQKVADFPFIDQLGAQLRKAHQEGQSAEARESPRTNLLWCEDEKMNIQVVNVWSEQSIPGPISEAPPARPLDGRKLRIGYLSSDFRDHPTSRLINGVLRHHDRTKFEVFLYDSGWDDGSDMRKEIVSHVDGIFPVASLSDQEGAKLIRSHNIDVLIELNGPTRANRMGVLKYRAAPIQIDYLGWPGSVGGRVVDYVVGDSYCVPEGVEALYAEKVIRLHKIYQVNDYLALKVPEVPSRAQLGLPEGVPVIGMFNAINKVHGEVWDTWMKIMKAVPNAVLWLLDPGPVARRNIAKACAMRGVDPKRVLAAPAVKQEAHLARLGACDIMVDPWPYGGHTSTSDALFAGVPVVAVAGTNFASRVSGGLLRAAGLEALVQPTLEGYVRTAVRLLRDPKELERVRAFIRDNIRKADIFDAQGKTRQFEAAYVDAFQRALAGLPPRHMTFRRPGKKSEAQTAATAPGTAAAPAAAQVAAPAQAPSAGATPSGVVAAAEQPATVADNPAVNPDAKRIPVVLVCGPWSSGTSAVAGMLAKAGLFAPGPYLAVNDPKTPATYEMKAFQQLMKSLASEATMELTATPKQILQALRDFRDNTLQPLWEKEGGVSAGPVLLKHALSALMLPQLSQVFDVKVVSVVRPLDAIEATRVRRSWMPTMGSAGARVVYRNVFEYFVAATTPFITVRYSEVIANPAKAVDELASFCGLQMTAARKKEAIAFVARPQPQAPRPVVTA